MSDPEVYPRECGGTSHLRTAGTRSLGLSPRVRGNPQTATPRRRLSRSIPASAGNRLYDLENTLSPRSIPASAGEPVSASKDHRVLSVYPASAGEPRVM